ncbi:MAG: hypothetical protein ACHQ7M_18595, partial [Chloroflexota bacterium]
SKATADASGNVKGWDLIQQNFNQKLDEAKGHVQAMAIQFGQQLLPALSGTLDFIDSKVLPGFERVGGIASAAASAFGKLPGPVKDVTLALAGLIAAQQVGLLSGIVSGVEKLGAGVASLGSAAKTTLTSWGPLVLGVAALTAAYSSSQGQLDDWAKALEQGGSAATAAADAMDAAHTRSIADAHSMGDAWNIVKGAFADGLAQFEGYSSAMDKASSQAQQMHDALPPLQRAQQDVTSTSNDLAQAIHDYGANSKEAKDQAWLLGLANSSLKATEQELKVASDGVNGSLQGQIGLQQQLAQTGQNYDEAIYNTGKAVDSYSASMKLGKQHTDEQHQALDNVTQSFFNVLDAARRKADAETQGLPQAQIANQEIVRQRDALDEVVKKLGFVPPALQGMYDSLNGPTAKALQAAQTNVNNMGTGMTTVVNNDINGPGGLVPALQGLATAAGSTVPQAITGSFLPSTDKMNSQLNG